MLETAMARQYPHDSQPYSVAVLVVPLPAQGHLNQLLQLSRLVATYGIPVHYVGSTSHNRQAKARVHGSWDPQTSSSVHFHDLQLSHSNGPPPPPKADTGGGDPSSRTKFPAHLQPVFEAASQLRQPVSRLLWVLASEFKRVVVIHDSLMGSVIQDVKSISNAESYTFHTVSAFALFFYIWELSGKPDLQLDAEVPNQIPPNEGCFTCDFSDFLAKQYSFLSLSSGRLYNTSRSIEDKYMDLLQKLPLNSNKKLYAIGPLNPVVRGRGNGRRKHRCLDWLDRQPLSSVLYVSFGTTTSLTDIQIKELATGLERSEQRFIWALREADRGDGQDATARGGSGEDQLPKVFEERVKERGMVVRDWAPQLEILGHPSTGGFLSHCGWNSCIESISMGVPLAAWPMHSDQPKNTVLVTQVLRVGLAVKNWECRDKLVGSSAVENAVTRLMASKEGDEMRQRAAELAADVRDSVASDGVSRLEMDSFIAHITR